MLIKIENPDRIPDPDALSGRTAKVAPGRRGLIARTTLSFSLTLTFLLPHAAFAQQATSLLGKPLHPAKPSEKLLERLAEHQKNYEADPSADNLIWFARFQAYSGDYRAAIETLTKGIQQYPDDARMFRHRGHRYISIREFDKAIADFDRAIELIDGKPNEIEPDGMPNERNIPVSTLHGNIWYHKGLAHYLKAEWNEALKAYQTCQRTGENDDNIVSSGHWIHSILSRMGKHDEAKKSLENIEHDMDIIENHSYHRACLFYKGLITAEELTGGLDDTPSGDSIRYAYANWLLTHGNTAEAKAAMEKIVAADGWASFGHIAAEADLARMRK